MDAIKVYLFSLRPCFSFFDNLKINCLRFSIRNVFLNIFFFFFFNLSRFICHKSGQVDNNKTLHIRSIQQERNIN